MNKHSLSDLIYSFFVMVCITITIVYISYSYYEKNEESTNEQVHRDLIEIWKVEK